MFLSDGSMVAISALAPKSIDPRGGGERVSTWLEEDETIYNTYKPRARRWLNAKQTSNKFLAKVIDKEEVFWFKHYSYMPRDITNP